MAIGRSSPFILGEWVPRRREAQGRAGRWFVQCSWGFEGAVAPQAPGLGSAVPPARLPARPGSSPLPTMAALTPCDSGGSSEDAEFQTWTFWEGQISAVISQLRACAYLCLQDTLGDQNMPLFEAIGKRQDASLIMSDKFSLVMRALIKGNYLLEKS